MLLIRRVSNGLIKNWCEKMQTIYGNKTHKDKNSIVSAQLLFEERNMETSHKTAPMSAVGPEAKQCGIPTTRLAHMDMAIRAEK